MSTATLIAPAKPIVTTPLSPAQIRVRRGAKLLDRYRPGWASEINLKEFDLGSCARCILGQLYSHYLTGLGVLSERSGSGLDEPDHYGFALDQPTTEFIRTLDQETRRIAEPAACAPLTAAWRDEIAARVR